MWVVLFSGVLVYQMVVKFESAGESYFAYLPNGSPACRCMDRHRSSASRSMDNYQIRLS